MSQKSKYAPTLNALCDMQQSPAYALRRQVLADAEQAIVSLEAQRGELLAVLSRWVDDDGEAGLLEMQRVTKATIAKCGGAA